MKKSIILWSILVVLLLISLPGIIQRWNVEAENKTYELVIPYEELAEFATNDPHDLDGVIHSLKGAGLTAVSLSPLTLYEMKRQGIISIYNKQTLEGLLRFTADKETVLRDDGYYITVPKITAYDDLIVQSFDIDKVTIDGELFYFVPNNKDFHFMKALGYDPSALELIEKHQLHLVLRIENDRSPANNEHMVDAALNNTHLNPNILFLGDEVVHYPDIAILNESIHRLNKTGSSFYTIEFTNQLGMQTVARNTNYKIIRLHSMDLEDKPLEENIAQAVRAVKERNIRSILFHIQTSDHPEQNLEQAISFIEGVHQKMPSSFELGKPKAFDFIELTTWNLFFLLAAGILFSYLAIAALIQNQWVPLGMIGLMLSLAVLYVITENLILLQAFGFIIAVITPTYAVLATIRSKTSITVSYMKALFFSFIGILIVVGLFSKNEFITGMELFRGVKLLHLLPLLFVGVLLFYKAGLNFFKKYRFAFLQANVKYWHVLLFLLIGGVIFYYVNRTGNAGQVSQLELMIRQSLEEYLYVRPRTKEFLIGFPLFLLGLYMIRDHTILGKLLLIPGTIGFLSIFNTFTHFHTPLHLSLLRTLYSIILGYLIGMLLIYCYKKTVPAITRSLKRRMS